MKGGGVLVQKRGSYFDWKVRRALILTGPSTKFPKAKGSKNRVSTLTQKIMATSSYASYYTLYTSIEPPPPPPLPSQLSFVPVTYQRPHITGYQNLAQREGSLIGPGRSFYPHIVTVHINDGGRSPQNRRSGSNELQQCRIFISLSFRLPSDVFLPSHFPRPASLCSHCASFSRFYVYAAVCGRAEGAGRW